jgi:rod shape-determining protein MreC
MFSKKMVMIVGVIVLIAVNIIVLSVSNRRYQSYGPGRIAISLIAPFQEAVSKLSNIRLRSLLNFQKTITNKVIAAEVIGKDPSPWFKTIMINKGKDDGVEKGAAVVIPQGIVGQVAEVSVHNSKVLLIIDHNSAVDALVQRTRARGERGCSWRYRCFIRIGWCFFKRTPCGPRFGRYQTRFRDFSGSISYPMR